MFRSLLVLAAILLASPSANAVEVEVNFETFDAPLAAHGEWVVVGDYGRVWHPRNVDSGWRPYYDGHWAWTDEGYMWISDEPWAWATYHYGRWSYEPGWGWIWVPGYEWAPAWVEWRYSEGAVGWAPLFPTTVVVSGPVAYEHWTFVPVRSFVGVPVATVAFSPVQIREQWGHSQAAPTYHHATAASGQPATAVAYGPPRVYVEQHVGHALVAVKPIAVSSPAEASQHRGAAVVYRPPTPAAQTRVEPAHPAPARVEPAHPAPARVEPAHPAPARVEPARPAPARVEPAHPAPARVEPARPAPARVEPAHPAPARVEPARAAPARVEPARPAPARVEPARPAPARVEPARPAEPERRAPQPEPARPTKREDEGSHRR